MAQSLQDAGPPAEFPPASYEGRQYVDSRGCVYVRAGIGGNVDWVPRVNRERELLCGFEPSIASGTGTTTRPQPREVPNPLAAEVAEAPAETAPAPAPVETAAASPAPAAPRPTSAARGLPTSTANAINPLTGNSVAAENARIATAPTPQVIRQPAPVTAAPAAEGRRTITRSEACAGRSGIQPNMISARTGQPINCGPAAEVVTASVAAPVAPARPAQTRMTMGDICADMDRTGRQYINSRTGLPVRCGPQTQPVSPRGQVASVGTVTTVAPTVSATTTTAPARGGFIGRIRAGLVAPQRPYSNPLDSAPGSTYIPTNRTGYQGGGRATVPGMGTVNTPTARVPGMGTVNTPTARVPGMGTVNTPTAAAPGTLSYVYPTAGACAGYDDGSALPIRCGPQVQSPWSSGTVVASAAPTTRTGQNTGLAGIFNSDPPPYSNPSYARQNIQPTPPAGYQMAWTDDRLNPNRGLPGQSNRVVRYATQATASPPATETTARVSTRTAPQSPRAEAISGQRYVQVGTFSSRDSAQRAAQGLRAQGLPMRIGVYERGGVQYRIVLAGPFGSSSQLQNALGTARSAGYAGAFARN